MLSITTSTSDELFSRINIDNFKRPQTSKIRGFIDFCNDVTHSSTAAHTQRMNRDEMARDKTDSLRTGTAIGFRAYREH